MLERVPQVCVEVVLERDGQVLLARRTDPDAAVDLDEQHDDYRFVADGEGGLHESVQRYLADMDPNPAGD